MFDSYTMNVIENVGVVGLEEANNFFKSYLANIGLNYNPSVQILDRVYKPKKCGPVNLSEVRRCFIWFLVNNSFLSLNEIAKVVGVKDHTTVIYHRDVARGMVENKDPRFLAYYAKLISSL